MQLSEYVLFDGLELAALVQSGDVTPRELADAALACIEQVNPEVNAVIGLLEAETEAAIARCGNGGAFAGVPFLIKDIGISFAGALNEMGSRLAKGVVAPHNSELAVRFKRAGVLTLGRTNTPEFGISATTEPIANGASRNPWNPGYSTGGSSGGSAAAVAAGMVPIAHANDGGGSIRFPASCCGVFGLKPSRGRVPSGPDADEFGFGLGAQLAVSRSVRDSAAMLDAVAGPDVGTRILLPPPERPYLEEVDRDPGRLRIAFATTAPEGGSALHPDCVEAVQNTARLCEELGHSVEEAAPAVRVQDMARIFLDLAGTGVVGWLEQLAAMTGRPLNTETLEATTLAVLEHGRRMSATEFCASMDLVNTVARTSGRFFSRYDIWLSPVMARPPLRLGELDANAAGLSAQAWFEQTFNYGPFTTLFNATGQPAMSVPLYWTDENLPIGIQFAARLGEEGTLFRLAGQLEKARPWWDRRPPVSG